MKRTQIELNKKGQATIEFAMCLVTAFAVTFFMIQTSFLLSAANFVQYAVFMSARAYLSSGVDAREQAGRARKVLEVTIKSNGGESDRFALFLKSSGDDSAGQMPGVTVGSGPVFRANPWQQGVSYQFKGKVFLLPFSGSKKTSNQVELTSESWLGKEASEVECLAKVKEKKGIIDNGC